MTSRQKGLFFGLFIVLLSLVLGRAKASEPATTKLRQCTLHIAIGTGSVIEGPSGDHYLLTNQHVCNSGSWLNKIRANYEGGTLIEGNIVKQSWEADLCVAKVSRAHAALKLAKTLSPREQIYTRGYPYGVLSETSGQYVGKQSWQYEYPIEEVGECFPGSKKMRNGNGNGNGTVRGCSIRFTDNVTNMYSRPGSSGSPVVNAAGEVVGVMSSWLGDKDAGGMVQLEQIQEFMKDL